MYGFGVIGPDPQRSLLWMIGGVVCFSIALAALTGVIVIPGVLVFAFVRWQINAPRGVAVTDQGIVITKESPFDARPRQILGWVALDQIAVVVARTRSHVCVQLGPEAVWLRHKEHQILGVAAQTAQALAASAPPS